MRGPVLLDDHAKRHAHDPGFVRRADHPRRGGDRHSRLRAAEDQPGHRLHPRRDRRRPVRAWRDVEGHAVAAGGVDHRPRRHRAVRRVRDHPVAVRDRARTELQALVGDAPPGVRHRRRRACRRRPADRQSGWSQPATALPPQSVLGLALGHVLDRAGDPDRRHVEPGRPRRLRDAAVRGSCARPLVVPVHQPWRRRGTWRPAHRGLEGRPRHRRDADRRALPAAAPVRPGGPHQEPRAVPGGQPARRHSRQPCHQRGRPQPDPRRAYRRASSSPRPTIAAKSKWSPRRCAGWRWACS